MNDQKRILKNSARMSILWILICLLTLGGATFAWFSFTPSTNITPMQGSVSGSGVTLKISNERDGVYDYTCELVKLIDDGQANFEPVSTYDLNSFYEAVSMDSNNYANKFRQVEDKLDSRLFHGIVYIKSEDGACDLYLNRDAFSSIGSNQFRTALRLGMIFTGDNDRTQHIVKFDSISDVGDAEAIQTTEGTDVVVAAVDVSGNADFEGDPAADLSEFSAEIDGDAVSAGRNMLIHLERDEIAEVEYWFYLEGCDENCINAVWEKTDMLNLAFAGVKADT